jgi:hypothetical protein
MIKTLYTYQQPFARQVKALRCGPDMVYCSMQGLVLQIIGLIRYNGGDQSTSVKMAERMLLIAWFIVC